MQLHREPAPYGASFDGIPGRKTMPGTSSLTDIAAQAKAAGNHAQEHAQQPVQSVQPEAGSATPSQPTAPKEPTRRHQQAGAG